MPDWNRDYEREPLGSRTRDLWAIFTYGIMVGAAVTLIFVGAR